MSVILSTGFRNALLVTGSAKASLDGGTLKIYSGTVPTNADAALSGNTMICEIFVNNDGSTPLTFAATATAGAVTKTVSEAWAGTVGNGGGTATFYRFEMPGDTGGLNTTEVRYQGTVNTSGADMNLLPTVSLVNGATQTINGHSLSIPSGA